MRTSLGRHILTEVGVAPDAEDIYQYLLGAPRSTAAQIATHCEMSRSRVSTALAELEHKAMVNRQGPASAPQFQPAPPDLMVEALISAREDALRRTRLEALQFSALQRFAPEHADVGDLVELLTSRQASRLRWTQLVSSAKTSVDVFVRMPFQAAIGSSEDLQGTLLKRNVVTRAIYDDATMQHPGVLEHVTRMTGLGERARVVTELPTKLALIDRTTAIMPFTGPGAAATIDAGLVVHHSTLLDALIALFDLYWERGTELTLGDRPSGDSRDDAEDIVLTLMAAGYKDDAIAKHLGVSTATVRRRIIALEKRMRVSTRFQAGLELGRSGWRSDGAEATTGRSNRTSNRTGTRPLHRR